MIESSAEELLDLVRQEKLDMAIVDNTNRDRSLHFRKLCQRNFYAALPADHPLANNEYVLPQQLSHEPQVVFHDAMESAFSQWASGVNADERVLSIVNTARSALDLVEAGVGICLLSEDCLEDRQGLRFAKIRNWHQALYMCILYDKWLEPPVWEFVERLVKMIRSLPAKE
jgi:DNA-binding transcriptional LysR family regulator